MSKRNPNDHQMSSEEMKKRWPDLEDLPTKRTFGDGLYSCKDCGKISRDRQCHECWVLEL